MAEQPEIQLQSSAFLWHWNNFPLERGLLHANNNNSYNATKGNQNKSLGVVKGVADMEYVTDGGKIVFIEMKTTSGSQSPDQKYFQAQVENRGARYVIIRSLTEFKALIQQYQPDPTIFLP